MGSEGVGSRAGGTGTAVRVASDFVDSGMILERIARRYPALSRLVDRFTASRLSHLIGDTSWLSSRSRFIEECRQEPGGYYALDLVYQYEPAGASPLDRLADWYYLNCPYATAARMRLTVSAAWLEYRVQHLLKEKGKARVLSLACGGARDSVVAFADMPGREHVEFLGVDISDDAVRYARRLAQDAGLSHFRFKQRDVLDMDSGSKDDFDLVLAVGLFHYVGEGAMKNLLGHIHEILPEGGRLLFDIAVRNPSRRFFEEKLGWHIRYQNLDDALALSNETLFSSSRLFCNCKDCFQILECTK